MAFLENVLYSVINGKRTITGPIFIKDFDKNNQQLNDLMELSKKVTSIKKDFMERDIMFLKKGIEGEQNVYFELKNSFIPMLCLHDIRLEYKDYAAQLDFVIITKKFIYVLETKKLNGDIEITPDGDFIRIIKNNSGKFIKKEGMYSPISQNQRHVNILKEILVNNGLIKNMPIKSAVIIANPKTIVNKYKAPKAVQYNLYKFDQIVNLLKREISDPKNDLDVLEKYLYAIANFLIENNKPTVFDYISRYGLTEDDYKADLQKIDKKGYEEVEKHDNYVEDSNLEVYRLLKKYRLETSRKEGVKPYFIFNNAEMDELIKVNPKSKSELLQVKDFGQKKIEKYGDEILEILNKHYQS